MLETSADSKHNPTGKVVAMSDVQSTVEYRDVPGFPGYRVGNDGSVWSNFIPGTHATGGPWKRMSSAEQSRTSHQHVVLCNGSRNHATRLVHRLVLEVFVGPCPAGMECCHNDGDASNNCVDNLRWDTLAANRQDMVTHGRSTSGRKSVWAKLTDEIVCRIRIDCAAGVLLQREIAAKYGVTQTLISQIARRKIWKHVL